MWRDIETSIRRARLGLFCCVVGAVGLILSAVEAKAIGYTPFRHFLLFALLGDAYGACFFLWLLRRMKKQQSAKQSD